MAGEWRGVGGWGWWESELEWGGGGGEKNIKKSLKIAISRKMKVSQFSGKYFLFGVIFQNGFSPKAVQPEAPGFRGDPKANLEVFCHEATFQECHKS